ncbi:hypothetical protein GN958_ATG03813 [Phytophthora infestans]|uniref:Uncharacterized protein n=1 Tax=Phytophthora infestans TaxID=4787 RepID=A0A8S9V6H7_PHYIN|nr:hypothetical protein GN958_ATG03813 [Phytophthora infestans]
MAKHRVADIRRDEKQAKENRAIARATSAVAAQKGERDRVADEEIRGGQAREQALVQLHKKQPIAAEKRKRTPMSHHVADDGVNDQGPSTDSGYKLYIQLVLTMWHSMCCKNLSPGNSPQRENAPLSSSCVTRSLSMDAGEADINNTAVATVRFFSRFR